MKFVADVLSRFQVGHITHLPEAWELERSDIQTWIENTKATIGGRTTILKDRDMIIPQKHVISMQADELLDILDNYSKNDIRRYAVACMLYHKFSVKTEAVIQAGGDKWVRCRDCDDVFDVGFLGYLWQYQVTFCERCMRHVSVSPVKQPKRKKINLIHTEKTIARIRIV